MTKRNLCAGWKIFHNLYRVKIQNAASSNDFANAFKAPVEFSSPEDYNSYLTETTTVLRTINNVIEHFRIGTLVVFEDINDYGRVYEILERHLSDWDKLIANPVRTQNLPPTEDIFIIQAYMDHIYDDAMFALGTKNAAKVIESRNGRSRSFINLFGGRNQITEQVQTSAIDIEPQRVIKPGGYFAELVDRIDN